MGGTCQVKWVCHLTPTIPREWSAFLVILWLRFAWSIWWRSHLLPNACNECAWWDTLYPMSVAQWDTLYPMSVAQWDTLYPMSVNSAVGRLYPMSVHNAMGLNGTLLPNWVCDLDTLYPMSVHNAMVHFYLIECVIWIPFTQWVCYSADCSAPALVEMTTQPQSCRNSNRDADTAAKTLHMHMHVLFSHYYNYTHAHVFNIIHMYVCTHTCGSHRTYAHIHVAVTGRKQMIPL